LEGIYGTISRVGERMSVERYCDDCRERVPIIECGNIGERIIIGTEERSIELKKICPLGTDVGGFLWQCPKCKTITADFTTSNVCESCTRTDCHSTVKNYRYCGAYLR
jgi:hypothetical protein